jgi:hypothetical protein
MSLSSIPLRVLPSIDPVLDFSHERQFTAYNGGKEISYTPFPAQAVNNSNIQVTINPPDEKTVVDPEIYVGVSYNLAFTGTPPANPPGANLLQIGVYDGPRAYPIASTTSTVDLKMNGTSFNTNLNEYWSSIYRTGMYSKDLNTNYSTTPDMLDQSLEYYQLAGSSRNPLNDYGSSVDFQQTRGSFPMTVNSNTPNSANVDMTVVERLFLSPFYPSKNGFAGVKTMTITFTFSDLKRIWSHALGVNSSVISNLVVNITGLTMYFRYITPKLLEQIPKQIVWPYHEFLISSTTLQTPIQPGASAVINMSAINLEAVPKRVLVVVREQDSDLLSGPLNFTKTDTYARIDQISVNYGNDQGKLSSASPQDLYNIARRNGVNLSWVQWNGDGQGMGVGSVLPLDIGKDIGLDELNCPSKLSNPLLSMKLNFTNLNLSRAITFSLFVFIIYEGSAAMNHGSVTKSIAILNSQDVLNTQKGNLPVLIQHQPSNIYGGDFFSSIKSALGKANDFLKNTKVISKAVKHLGAPGRVVGEVANAFGYGMGEGGAVIERAPFYYDLEQAEYKGGRKKKAKKAKKPKKKHMGDKMSRRMLMRRGGNLDDKHNKQKENESDNESDSQSDSENENSSVEI